MLVTNAVLSRCRPAAVGMIEAAYPRQSAWTFVRFALPGGRAGLTPSAPASWQVSKRSNGGGAFKGASQADDEPFIVGPDIAVEELPISVVVVKYEEHGRVLTKHPGRCERSCVHCVRKRPVCLLKTVRMRLDGAHED
jgi:hypothetical protein